MSSLINTKTNHINAPVSSSFLQLKLNKMVGSCLSIVSLFGRYLNRCLTASGLVSHNVDAGTTTTHIWGPPAPTSKPALILIHGFGPQGVWQWRYQVSFFAQAFDVYVPDLLFFGDSFTSSSERSEIFQADCLVKALQKLGVSSRYSMIGTSYGGFVAYHMALMWPERVDKVVIASSAVNMRRNDNVQLVKKVNANSIEDVLLPTTAGQLRQMLNLCIYRLPPYVPDFVLNDFLDKLFSENRKEKLELLQGLTIGRDETVGVSPLQQEVLIVWGEHDQIFSLERGIELKKLLGEKASLQVIKKTSHVPQLERPAQFNNIVKNFLNGSS